EEVRLLREASAREWRGDLAGAEAVLVALLREHPVSTGGIFALERILRGQGREREVLPWADRFLEGDPVGAGVRYMKLRVLADLDSVAALEAEARAWFRAEPGAPDPYREVARLYQRTRGAEAALALLREGREALGDRTAFAREAGDLLAELGDGPGAVDEWSRALETPEMDVDGVLRRVGRLPGDPSSLAPPLLRALAAPPATPERRVAAVRVALALGLAPPDAMEVARQGLAALPASGRRAYLSEVASHAEGAGRAALSLWALREARALAPERERTPLDLRIADMALQAGDTATALEARARLARTLPPGSAERRRVLAELIRVESGSAPAVALAGRLAAFRASYPDAPELDGLQAGAVRGLLARGDAEGARQVLTGTLGPLAAVEAGYLHLLRGEVEPGTALLEGALAGLPPLPATEVLSLLAALRTAGPRATVLLARAAALGHQGAPGSGVDLLVGSLAELPDEDRAPVMARAGALAESAGLDARAEELLEALLQGYPDAVEAPEAALQLARLHLRRGDTGPAREVLEALILRYPASPVVPAARRELSRVREGAGARAAGGER
ncbi:MAG: tetratricopeptide repeat protein, partial [Longimicrobiales bacterium]|nr:tetratricopeptide repeat protein [Longimicrobiales bacterium]